MTTRKSGNNGVRDLVADHETRIRALEAEQKTPLHQRLPAIALSGYASPEDRMRALLAGFQLHLGKPIDSRELVASIGSLIGGNAERTGAEGSSRIH